MYTNLNPKESCKPTMAVRATMLETKATAGDGKATSEQEVEDPIMKAEREFFEIIKKVSG